MKEDIIKFLLKFTVKLFINFYREFGETKVKALIDNTFSSIDEDLESKLGKEYATKLEGEILDILQESVIVLKKNMEN